LVGTDGSDGDLNGADSEANRNERRPVVVGEVLFDQFPDGSSVLGGAPFNVAWHLQAFGLRPLVVTRVGDDELGDRVLQTMGSWRMSTTGVQLDRAVPTGRVQVSIDDGGPRFDIPEDQAFDVLETKAAQRVLDGIDVGLLYHGSLIARSGVSGEALRAIRESVSAPVFIDVNLRAPWWGEERVGSLVRGSRWVKLNEEELAQLHEVEGPTGGGGLEQAAAEFARSHEIGQLVVTCGERGALVSTDGASVAGRPPQIGDIVDTVGAGDAFSAVWIVGAMRGWPPATALARALDFAAAICRVRGATTDAREIYDQRLEAWSLT
jgi:fructokinase